VFIGSSGVGKTHLTISSGIETADKESEHFLLIVLNYYSYLERHTKKGTSHRNIRQCAQYERDSTTITNNSDLSAWIKIFHNLTITDTILE